MQGKAKPGTDAWQVQEEPHRAAAATFLDSGWPLAKGHSEASGQAVAIYKRQAHGGV